MGLVANERRGETLVLTIIEGDGCPCDTTSTSTSSFCPSNSPINAATTTTSATFPSSSSSALNGASSNQSPPSSTSPPGAALSLTTLAIPTSRFRIITQTISDSTTTFVTKVSLTAAPESESTPPKPQNPNSANQSVPPEPPPTVPTPTIIAIIVIVCTATVGLFYVVYRIYVIQRRLEGRQERLFRREDRGLGEGVGPPRPRDGPMPPDEPIPGRDRHVAGERGRDRRQGMAEVREDIVRQELRDAARLRAQQQRQFERRRERREQGGREERNVPGDDVEMRRGAARGRGNGRDRRYNIDDGVERRVLEIRREEGGGRRVERE